MIKILIIEDDPMVAMLNKEFSERVENFEVIGQVKSADEAWAFLDIQLPDLILLDVYLPGGTGINFAKQLQERKKYIPIIMITAADDTETVKQAISYGAADYLIKPFTFERFKAALHKVIDFYGVTKNAVKTDQNVLDRFFLAKTPEVLATEKAAGLLYGENPKSLPKGLSKITLRKVSAAVAESKEWFSTEGIAEKIDISRISTKKYLQFLADSGILKEEMDYRNIGRPVTVYKMEDTQKDELLQYLK